MVKVTRRAFQSVLLAAVAAQYPSATVTSGPDGFVVKFGPNDESADQFAVSIGTLAALYRAQMRAADRQATAARKKMQAATKPAKKPATRPRTRK